MKVLITIPHFHREGEQAAAHGSNRDSRRRRAEALGQCLTTLYETFGRFQCTLDLSHPSVLEANSGTVSELTIVICTVPEHHALDELQEYAPYFKHHEANINPKLLGFECHRCLADHREEFDLYCLLEDDLLVADPLAFLKVMAFARRGRMTDVLLPNRYERRDELPFLKAYLDGPLAPKFTNCLRPYDGYRGRIQEPIQFMDQVILMQRPNNPHAGCFFLTHEQFLYWRQRHNFRKPDTSFVSPLESAATLAIYKHFDIFKPAPRFANFFEIQHLGHNNIDYYLRRMMPSEAPSDRSA